MLLNGINFEYNVLDNWFDTGNKESYKIVCEYFKPIYNVLEKDYESICFFEDKVIKFINDPEINKKRIERGNNLYPIAPKILAYSDNFISMEKIKGPLLAKHYSHGEIKNLLKWATHNLWINEDINKSYLINSKNFYITKTLNRIQRLDILNDEYNIINGLYTDSAINMINNLNYTLLTTDTFTTFHGDFILDNIIKVEDGYKLLDWRHEFDTQLIYGDKYYDLAKLRHNIIFNHENITNNLYFIEYNNEEVIFLKNHGIVLTHNSIDELYKLLDKVIYLLEKIININYIEYKITNYISKLMNNITNTNTVSFLSNDYQIKNLFFQYILDLTY